MQKNPTYYFPWEISQQPNSSNAQGAFFHFIFLFLYFILLILVAQVLF